MAKILALSIFFAGLIFFSAGSARAADSICLDLTYSFARGSSDTSTNKNVTALQNFLRDQNLFLVEPTGYFGKITEASVKDFQAREGISAVGIVGPLTRAAIKNLSCAKPPSEPVSVDTGNQGAPPAVLGGGQTASVVDAVSLAVPVEPEKKSVKLPYQSFDFSDWKRVWGEVSTTSSGRLLIKAATTTSGAEALLINSDDWTDYRLTASLIVSNGGITLIGRYADNGNYFSCNFDKNRVTIEKHVNKVSERVASVTLDGRPNATFFGNSTNVSMRVKGNTVGCSAISSGDDLIYVNTDGSLAKGAVGVLVQGVSGAASIELLSVRAEAI